MYSHACTQTYFFLFSAFSSNKKLYLPSLPLYDKQRCRTKYAPRGSNPGIVLGEGQFCAGGVAAQDSCTGDSGGPVMIHEKIRGVGGVFKQLGIVSFGPAVCGLPDRPGIYTKVEAYMDWIYQNLKP